MSMMRELTRPYRPDGSVSTYPRGALIPPEVQNLPLYIALVIVSNNYDCRIM
jgi:hypothetical protein